MGVTRYVYRGTIEKSQRDRAGSPGSLASGVEGVRFRVTRDRIRTAAGAVEPPEAAPLGRGGIAQRPIRLAAEIVLVALVLGNGGLIYRLSRDDAEVVSQETSPARGAPTNPGSD